MRIRDWSSDVCSSDLDPRNAAGGRRDMRLRYRRRSTPRLHRRWHRGGPPPHRGVQPPQTKALTLALTPTVPAVFTGWILLAGQRLGIKKEIGSAPCRERVCQSV